MDVLGWLSVEQWLALLRVMVGLWWLKSFFHKPLRKFVRGQMADWTLSLADNHPMPLVGNFMKALIEPNRTWFPYLVLAGELAVGVGLSFGLLTPIAALVGIFLNLNYLLLAGVKPRDRSVNPAYQCEQGQNLMMMASELVIFMLGAGAVWSLDAILALC
jgi:thiosulfate dehydrogenase [quinone] large subunit